jgi:hypothetical protein
MSLLLLAAAQSKHYYDSAGTQRPLQPRVAYTTALWRVLVDKSDAVYHPAAALRNLVVGPLAEEVSKLINVHVYRVQPSVKCACCNLTMAAFALVAAEGIT